MLRDCSIICTVLEGLKLGGGVLSSRSVNKGDGGLGRLNSLWPSPIVIMRIMGLNKMMI